MKNSIKDKVISIVGLVVVIAIIIGLIGMSNTKKPISENVWTENMTMGDTESPKRHYIMYTDILCPYCDVFTRATMEYADEFAAYLDEHHILFEIRMTDLLYYSGAEFSNVAAEGAYCAANEGKFWEYYHSAVSKLWTDYHSKGIGDSKTSPQITDMTNDWWLSIAEPAGLSENWASCVENEDFAQTIYDNTVKAADVTQSGLPYFSWNGKAISGLTSYFETWDELEEFLNMGL